MKKQNILRFIQLVIATALIVIIGLLVIKFDNPTELSITPTLRYRISLGEKTLVSKEEINNENLKFQEAKKSGVEAMLAGNYEQAVKDFEKAIQKYPNAPETLIYLNNAHIGKKKAYTIAVVVPIGSDPNGALEILRGVAQAQNEINRGEKINGLPLKVAIANDDDKPEIAKQIASALVNNREVLGVVGHYSSGATLSAGEEYKAGKLVTISPVSTAVEVSDFSPYVFRTVPNDAIAAKALAKYMLTKLQQQKAAVFFNSQSTYSKSLKKEFIEEVFANGEEVDRELEFDFSDSSFSARKSVEKAIERGTQVLMLAPNVGVLDKALLVVQANQRQLKLLGGDEVYSVKTLADGGEAAVGMVVAVAWHIDADPKSDFVRNSGQLWDGSRVNWRTAMSYDAAQALIAALKRDPTRLGVQQALSASDFSATGTSGSIRFLSSGDRMGTIQLVEVRSGNRSGTGYDFVPVPSN
jgi:branched-chain amino acid transport system substrate-binding protein